MRPSAVEMVRSIEHSFDAYIVPELRDPLASSAAAGIKNLLRHLAVRIEAEPQLLFEDSEDKRRLCRELAGSLRSGPATMAAPELAGMAAALEAAAARRHREPGTFPTLTSLAAENADLKEVVDRAIRELHACGDVLDPAERSRLSNLIAAQLQRQMEREAACFDNWYGGPMF